MSDDRHVLSIRRGHSPNCSATGTVVGLALVSAIAGAAVVNAFADAYLRWARPDRSLTPNPVRRRREPEPDDDDEPPEASGAEGIPRLRREAFGGILAWPEPAALLFLDEEGTEAAARAGAVEIGGAPSPPGGLSAPTEVHLQLTSRCPVRCDGCYLDAGPDAPSSDPVDDATLDALAEMGVLQVALGGGEALLRDDVVDVARRIRARGMVPNLTTSGFGLTPALAEALAEVVGQVNISLDGVGDGYRAVRGWDGTGLGLRALRLLRDAGVRAGVNTVLTAANVGGLDALADALVEHGVREWQWVRFKPAGRGADTYERLALSRAQASRLWPRTLELEARTGLTIRWDCALVPFLIEHDPPLELLQRLGVAGCPGGHSLWSRAPDGVYSPCSFAHDAATDPAADPAAAWRDDPTLVTWRDRAAAPPEPCASCPAQAVCRGGCRVVADHLTGDALAPDPECPRVIAWPG